MLNLGKYCKKYIPNMGMTIVDVVTSKEEQIKYKQICDNLGVKLLIDHLKTRMYLKTAKCTKI